MSFEILISDRVLDLVLFGSPKTLVLSGELAHVYISLVLTQEGTMSERGSEPVGEHRNEVGKS